MKPNHYDPLFYICSEEMPFTIRVEMTMTEPIDGKLLDRAVQKAIQRYPYFSVQVTRDGEDLITVPNDRPIAVYRGPEIRPLGSESVNGHMLAVEYEGDVINFTVSHVITDGGGFFPFTQTALYYYLCLAHDTELDPTGIRLVGQDLFPGEVTNPFPEDKMEAAPLWYQPKQTPYFRLKDGGYVTDDKRTAYRVQVGEADMMRFNHGNDASPCALVSTLLAKAITAVHPDCKEDIVSAVSFNYRAGLGNRYNYRMLCNALMLRYPHQLCGEEVSKLCTCTRGMITLQSQEENVLYYAEQRRRFCESVHALPTLKEKKRIVSEKALADSVDNTFSVSYVGNIPFGSLSPYIRTVFNVTDGSTYQTLFAEIAVVNGKFNIALLQGFSNDIYFRAFLDQLEACDLSYTVLDPEPFNVPGTQLPD